MGGPSNTVVAGPTLLLYLDDANASTIATKAAVLPCPAVTRRGVNACCRAATAMLLLASMNLHRETVNVKAAFTLMLIFLSLEPTGDDCKFLLKNNNEIKVVDQLSEQQASICGNLYILFVQYTTQCPVHTWQSYSS